MQQTFNDLCRERRDAGEGLVGFVLWTFADTFVGILREEMNAITQTFKKYGQIFLSVIVAIAMIGSALLWKGTERENTFLYILLIYFLLMAAIEVYSRTKRKDQ